MMMSSRMVSPLLSAASQQQRILFLPSAINPVKELMMIYTPVNSVLRHGMKKRKEQNWLAWVSLEHTNMILEKAHESKNLFSRKRKVPYGSIYAVGKSDVSRSLVVHFLVEERSASSSTTGARSLTPDFVKLRAFSEEQCELWIQELRHRANIEWTRTFPLRMLFIVNPNAGAGRAKTLLSKEIYPLLQTAFHTMPDIMEPWETVITERRNHCFDVIRTVDLSRFNVIACCGGDGIFNEALSGLLHRADWSEMRHRVSFAVVPAGSSNALAQSIVASTDPLKSVSLILKGHRQPMDVFSVWQNGERHICTCSVHFGLFADISKMSEEYRCMLNGHVRMGYSKYILGGIKALRQTRPFPGRVQFVRYDLQTKQLNANYESMSPDGPICPLLEKFFPEYRQKQSSDAAVADNKGQSTPPPPPAAVSTVDGQFLLAMMVNNNFIDKSIALVKGNVHKYLIRDGIIRVSFIRKRLSLLALILGLAQSRMHHCFSNAQDMLQLEHTACQAFKFIPYDVTSSASSPEEEKKGANNAHVDGEEISAQEPIYGEVHPSICNIITYVTTP